MSDVAPTYFTASDNELSPEAVVQLFQRSSPNDWIEGDGDTEARFGHKRNLLVSLWPRADGRLALRYGYQTVALVTGFGGDVWPVTRGQRRLG